MPGSTIGDHIRKEYFELLPEVGRVVEELEAEIRYCLIPIRRTLKPYN